MVKFCILGTILAWDAWQVCSPAGFQPGHSPHGTAHWRIWLISLQSYEAEIAKEMQSFSSSITCVWVS